MLLSPAIVDAQHKEEVKLVKAENENRVDVYIGSFLFTRFLYSESLEKPVLFPIYDAGNTLVTGGFPISPRPGEPTDHPHHVGLWLTYENVNGLDFWNNSYIIPADKKSLFGWIKTDRLLDITNGKTGVLRYHANWVNQKQEVLLEEMTRYEFSGSSGER